MIESPKAIFTEGLRLVLSFFPDSPFVVLARLSAENEFGTWFGMLNWFIPINTFVGILEMWLACVAVYYVWQVVLRWLKVLT